MQFGPILRFVETYKYGLPFLILFVASLFLPAASHRIIFYLTVPYIGYLLYLSRDDLSGFFRTRSFCFLVSYLGYFLLSSLWSEPFNQEEFWDKIIAVAGIAVFTTGLAVAMGKIPFSPNMVTGFAKLCVGYVLLCSVIYYLPDLDINARLEGLGRYENSIHLSFLMCYAILALFCVKMRGEACCNYTVWGLIALLVIAIAIAQTRSAYVALAFCMMLIAFCGHGRYVLYFAAACAVTAAVFFSVWGYAMELFLSRMDGSRFGIWRETWEGIVRAPLFGHGLLTEPRFYSEAIDPKSGWKSTHNVYLGHAYFGGIFGFMIGIALMGNMTWIALSEFMREKREKQAHGYLTLTTCFMVAFCLCVSCFNFAHYIVNVHIQWLVAWVPFALCWHIEATRRKRNEKIPC